MNNRYKSCRCYIGKTKPCEVISIYFLVLSVYVLSAQCVFIETPPEWHAYARLTGDYNDRSTDINGDGYTDTLTVEADVNVTSPGEYSLTGYLYDSNNKIVAWSIDHRSLSSGPNKMLLNFDSKDIRRNSSDGQFYLRDVLLTFGNSPSGKIIPTDWVYQACNTSTYNFSNSTASSPQEMKISGLGKGEVLLTVSLQKNIPVVSSSYSLDLSGLHIPPFSSDFKVSFPHITKNLSGYAYETEGIYMPSMPNNFSVSASGVKNLNIGLKKQQGGYKNSSDVWTDKYTRIWISSQATADENGVAKLESYLISPGIYQAKIFGDAAENATSVGLTMTLVKKIVVNGRFNLSINTEGFPSGSCSMSAKSLNGSLSLDELAVG